MSQNQSPRLHIDWIDPDALDIVQRLQKKGHRAYLVGGCVRDLLLGKSPKDYDIATTAHPREVKKLIYNSYIIGRRFRLVLAKRGEELFEIATFRRDPTPEERDDEDIQSDNLFGSPEDDANRRDFTINALFYDPVAEDLIDYVGGIEDLEAGRIRMIGDPVTRLKEDPIRILRAIRLAHMIRFQMDDGLKKGIEEVAPELAGTALPRRREEFLKFLRLEDPSQAFLNSYDLGVLQPVSPSLVEIFDDINMSEAFLHELREFHRNKMVSPLELFACFVVEVAKTRLGLNFDNPKLKSYRLSEDERLLPLMKDELGMFKSEQEVTEKALRALHHLQNKKSPDSDDNIPDDSRDKRIKSLFRSEAFPLALLLAEKEYLISPEDLDHWKSLYRAHQLSEQADGEGKGDRNGPKRRRRRRRHRPLKTSSNKNSS